jgi:polyisoprenoid-binding protein YceI
MTVVEERLPGRGEKRVMVGKAASERYEVVSADSSMTFFAMSTMQYVYGKTTELSGFIDVAWNPDGTLAVRPPPKMHVEFRVESLRTGNELQDREMWKLIDSKRFPKIAADLREASSGAARGRYTGTGQITLAGLARAYEGEFTLERGAKQVALHGDLNVDVRDFGLKPLKLLVLSVAPLVRVRLHLVTARVV